MLLHWSFTNSTRQVYFKNGTCSIISISGTSSIRDSYLYYSYKLIPFLTTLKGHVRSPLILVFIFSACVMFIYFICCLVFIINLVSYWYYGVNTICFWRALKNLESFDGIKPAWLMLWDSFISLLYGPAVSFKFCNETPLSCVKIEL